MCLLCLSSSVGFILLYMSGLFASSCFQVLMDLSCKYWLIGGMSCVRCSVQDGILSMRLTFSMKRSPKFCTVCSLDMEVFDAVFSGMIG